MTVLSDGKGNYLTQDAQGGWQPAEVRVSEQTGRKLINDSGEWKPLPGEEPSGVGSTLRGYVQGVTFGLGDELRAGTDALVQGAGNLIHGSEGRPTMGQAYDTSLAKSREDLQIDQIAHPNLYTAGEVVGGVSGATVGGAGLGAVRGATTAATVAPTLGRVVGQGALTGGVAGGVTGFGEGEGGLTNRLMGGAIGAGTGAVAGAALGAAATGASRVISPTTTKGGEYGRLVGVAKDEGIQLSPGEETGSRPLKVAETNLAQMPFAAGPAEDTADAAARSINKAVMSKAGSDADRITSTVLRDHTQKVGGEIGQLAEQNNLQMTPDFVQKLSAVRENLRFKDSEAARKLGARLDQLQGMITAPPGSVDAIVAGPQYRTLLSEVTRDMQNAGAGDTRSALSDFRNLLRTQMETSMSPEDATRWRQLNRQYANLAVIKDAMGGAGAGAAEGNISTTALRGAIDRSLGGDAYAMGYGDLNDIARIGQTVLRKPPDSGTAIRTFLNQLMTGGIHTGVGGTIGGWLGGPVGATIGGTAGALLGPRVVQTAMQSGPGRAYLTNQLASELDARLIRALAAGAGQASVPRNRLIND